MTRFKHIQYLIKLKDLIFSEKKLVFVLIIIKLMTMLLSLFPPFVYQYYINSVVSDKRMECMSYVIVGYIILFIAQTFVISLGKYLETKYSNSLRVNLKKQVFNIYSKLSYYSIRLVFKLYSDTV